MSAFTLPAASTPCASQSPLSAFKSLIDEVAGTSSKNDKQKIIEDALKSEDGAEFLDLLRYALSPYIHFGVKKIPDAQKLSEKLATEKRLNAVTLLLDGLACRELTGSRAQKLISVVLGSLDEDEEDIVRKILSKDLRAGFSESTVNKAMPGAIPVFSCQLANSKMPDVEDLSYPVVVEPKYDGVRCIAIGREGVVTLFSRNGKEFENFEEVRKYLEREMPNDFVFDGEIMHATLLGDEGYHAVMKRCKASTGKNVEGNPVCYQVFDGMDLLNWEAQTGKDIQFRDRRTKIEFHVADMRKNDGIVRLAPSHIAHSSEELLSLYQAYIDDGFEGVIIKTLDGGYTFKRNKTWMKLKPMDTVDLEIVDVLEGEGKYAGMMGVLICRGEHDGKTISTGVGTGFTDDMRRDLWQKYLVDKEECSRNVLIGHVIEVRYQDMTQDQDSRGSNTYSLRFPAFVRFRSDSDGQKV